MGRALIYGVVIGTYLCIISGNSVAPTGQQYDKKSGQWFGSLVQSSGDDGIILVRNFYPILQSNKRIMTASL